MRLETFAGCSAPRAAFGGQGTLLTPCLWSGAQRLSEGHQPGVSPLVWPRSLGWVRASRQQLPGKPARKVADVVSGAFLPGDSAEIGQEV